MAYEGRFHLGRAHTVAGHVQQIVDASGDPVVAVGIAAAAVAGEVFALVGREIGLHEALVVAIDRAHLARPGIDDTELPSATPSSTPASLSTSCGFTPKKGRVAEQGFRSVAPGSGVIRMPPVSICHQVSRIGTLPSPTTLKYHSQASGLIGSPTEPSTFSDLHNEVFTWVSPALISARSAVGAE